MSKVLKFGCLGFIGFVILMVIIGLALGDDSSTTTNESKEASKQETANNEADAMEKKVGIGEELTVGEVVFKVNSINEVNQISAGDGMFKYTPDSDGAVFLNVNITVKNNATEMIQTDSSFFKLIAENGAEYSPSTILVADDKYFAYEGINPGLELTGNVVFEVPSQLTGLQLQVQTGFWGTETGLISLN